MIQKRWSQPLFWNIKSDLPHTSQLDAGGWVADVDWRAGFDASKTSFHATCNQIAPVSQFSRTFFNLHFPFEAPALAFIETIWSKMPERAALSASLAIRPLNGEKDNVSLFQIDCSTTWRHETWNRLRVAIRHVQGGDFSSGAGRRWKSARQGGARQKNA